MAGHLHLILPCQNACYRINTTRPASQTERHRHRFLSVSVPSNYSIDTPATYGTLVYIGSLAPLALLSTLFLCLVTAHNSSRTPPLSMQVVSHPLALRGSSASRTRARWQPYPSIQPSTMRTPSSAYLHTPGSSSSTAGTCRSM